MTRRAIFGKLLCVLGLTGALVFAGPTQIRAQEKHAVPFVAAMSGTAQWVAGTNIATFQQVGVARHLGWMTVCQSMCDVRLRS